MRRKLGKPNGRGVGTFYGRSEPVTRRGAVVEAGIGTCRPVLVKDHYISSRRSFESNSLPRGGGGVAVA